MQADNFSPSTRQSRTVSSIAPNFTPSSAYNSTTSQEPSYSRYNESLPVENPDRDQQYPMPWPSAQNHIPPESGLSYQRTLAPQNSLAYPVSSQRKYLQEGGATLEYDYCQTGDDIAYIPSTIFTNTHSEFRGEGNSQSYLGDFTPFSNSTVVTLPANQGYSATSPSSDLHYAENGSYAGAALLRSRVSSSRQTTDLPLSHQSTGHDFTGIRTGQLQSPLSVSVESAKAAFPLQDQHHPNPLAVSSQENREFSSFGGSAPAVHSGNIKLARLTTSQPLFQGSSRLDYPVYQGNSTDEEGDEKFPEDRHHHSTGTKATIAGPSKARQADSPSRKHNPMGKKPKMHKCQLCDKSFPRPSGLNTHMNSHLGEKPFPCPIEGCNKRFAVRSNAKRHLRTHGADALAEQSSESANRGFIDFDVPIVSEVHECPRVSTRLRWVPQSLSTRQNVDTLRSESGSEPESSDNGSVVCPEVPVRLPPVTPSDDEERDSYAEAPSHPYHPTQWRRLPGPAAVPRVQVVV